LSGGLPPRRDDGGGFRAVPAKIGCIVYRPSADSTNNGAYIVIRLNCVGRSDSSRKPPAPVPKLHWPEHQIGGSVDANLDLTPSPCPEVGYSQAHLDHANGKSSVGGSPGSRMLTAIARRVLTGGRGWWERRSTKGERFRDLRRDGTGFEREVRPPGQHRDGSPAQRGGARGRPAHAHAAAWNRPPGGPPPWFRREILASSAPVRDRTANAESFYEAVHPDDRSPVRTARGGCHEIKTGPTRSSIRISLSRTVHPPRLEQAEPVPDRIPGETSWSGGPGHTARRLRRPEKRCARPENPRRPRSRELGVRRADRDTDFNNLRLASWE